MSQIDNELNLLKQRLAALEEQKRIEAEKEAEKKANPIKVLGEILDEKKKWVRDVTQCIEARRKSYNIELITHQLKEIDSNYVKPEMHFFNEKDKLAMLEPIFNMLVDIQKRLDALEKKE